MASYVHPSSFPVLTRSPYPQYASSALDIHPSQAPLHEHLLLRQTPHLKRSRDIMLERWHISNSSVDLNPCSLHVTYYTRSGFDDSDYNGHLSNSSYAKVCLLSLEPSNRSPTVASYCTHGSSFAFCFDLPSQRTPLPSPYSPHFLFYIFRSWMHHDSSV